MMTPDELAKLGQDLEGMRRAMVKIFNKVEAHDVEVDDPNITAALAALRTAIHAVCDASDELIEASGVDA